MKDIVLHIRYLLTQHDCVIVPGWGALVVQHNNAEFDTENNIVKPPHRWMSFNSLLAHNDGLLAHSLMRTQGCTYEQAVALIDEQVSLWRDDMRCKKTVTWERIGSFHHQDDTTMLFVEASDAEISATLSLLQPLTLPTLSHLLTPIDVEEESESAVEYVELQPSIRISWQRRAWQAVASIAVIVMVMLSISTPVDNLQTSNDYAGLVAMEVLGYNLSSEQEVVQSSLVEHENIITDVATEHVESDVINNELEPEAVEPQPVVDAQVELNDAVVVENNPRYILVIGSLPSLSKAQEQARNFYHAGVNENIKIYHCDGKYRLYIEGYNSMLQAQERLDLLTAQQDSPFAGMWICSTRK